MVMQDIHIDTLAAACEEGFSIAFVFDIATNACKHKSSRVYRFQVATRHLQDNGVG